MKMKLHSKHFEIIQIKNYDKRKIYWFITSTLKVFIFLVSHIIFSQQLSTIHYIPPLTASGHGESTPKQQFLYLSTPSTTDVNYTVKPIGLPATDYITGVISNTNFAEIDLGSTFGQLFINAGQTSTITTKGYVIESDSEIYASVRVRGGNSFQQADAITSKGETALGKVFRVGSYTNENASSNGSYLSFVSVMATEDNTQVIFSDITPGLSIINYTGTTPIAVTLNKYESYVIATRNDVSVVNRDGLIGTLVSSDKDIVVNCGSTSGSFSNGNNLKDYGIDQIVGLSNVGNEYIFVRGNGPNAYENVLIVAHTDNTTISIDGNTPITTINAGEYYLIEGASYSGSNMYVETSNPVFAYQGTGSSSNEANQSMYFVPPLNCSAKGGIDNIPKIRNIGTATFTGNITLVTKTTATITINNLPLSNFNTFGPNIVDGNTDYVSYSITNFPLNTITIQCDDELYCAYFNQNGSATAGAFYAGFQTEPVTECWETSTFNDATCTWDVTGAQPVQPTIECWETATFNTTTCSWDVIGTQPVQPTIECWETATFNTATCSWDINGTQPVQPTIECWETATFNTITCSWDVTGTQPIQPILEYWETATFNTTTCSWDVTGTQPPPLSLCGGNSGTPIFLEDFGTGTTNNSLPGGITTYNFANDYPTDGFYTVSNGTFQNGYAWHETEDHTVGDVNGKCLIVNASYSAGEFYKLAVSGLCEATTYEFSAWLLNLVKADTYCSTTPSGVIPVNVRFEIWDSTDTNLLAVGDTGDIIETSNPNWEEYGLVFQTSAGQDSVILKMINNGPGGCGNDLAIDDIEFKTCGDTIIVEDSENNNSISICSGETPFSTTLTAIPDYTVFSSHFYQWQESSDNNNWSDIPGATTETLSISGVTSTMYYRTKVAESAVNFNNEGCITLSDTYNIEVTQAPPPPTIECWQIATLNNATCSWEVSGTQPMQPTLECWETATFNSTTCSWDVTGIQPEQPDFECWQSASFNNMTCAWEITGTQPVQPTLECWETATFNTTTCSWDVTGTQPEQPSVECWGTTTFNNVTCSWEVTTGTQPEEPELECWETATFNNDTCAWDVTGTQPVQPTLECWEIATFNDLTCTWDVTGTQPEQPNLECWQSTSFNSATCTWEITGTQPAQPALECWETATFNTTNCSWDITGTQPALPTLECWETATFNSATCTWEITGTQLEQPALECWETATFNTTTCSWDVTGTQPEQPSVECWGTTTFNNVTCSWEVTTGTQPEEPELECWETATFNNDTCAWEITGTQPVQPTLECWETATFNSTTCSWDVTGIQPEQPDLECWQSTSFNDATCTWEITGTQPVQPTLECWETATFNTTTCSWDITGTQPVQPNLECWQSASFNNMTCSWEVTGTQPEHPNLECWQSTNFNSATCTWEITGTQPELPTLECWEMATLNDETCTWEVTGTQPEQPDLQCWEAATFNNDTCEWDITGTQPMQPTLECWETATFNNDTCTWDVTGTQTIEYLEQSEILCEGQTLTLIPATEIENPSYLWTDFDLQTTTINIEEPGEYIVEVTDGCLKDIITITVSLIEEPQIESVVSNEGDIVVNLLNEGDYEFSIDGVNYQESHIFSNRRSGCYTVYVRSEFCDFMVSAEHVHLFIPKFFTPNNDGKNDYFAVDLLGCFTSMETYIFNRYGKLLYYKKNGTMYWDGVYNGNNLPSSDYWYRIIIDGQEFKGHVTLKR